MTEDLWIDKVWPLRPVQKDAVVGFRTQEWMQCQGCQKRLFKDCLSQSHGVCPECGHHHRLSALAWIDYLTAGKTAQPIAEHVLPRDFLQFKDRVAYSERLTQAKKKTSATEAVVCVNSVIGVSPVVLCVFDFGFIGGSMGYVVGERIVQSVHEAITKRLPLVCVTASGGARMQEGVIGLFQMAKVSAAIARLRRHGLAFISVLADPTSGGVAASIAMQADIILAEKGALIGFTGPRVIAQTLKEALPEGFQKAEFLLESGAVDCVVKREDLPKMICKWLSKLMRNSVLRRAVQTEVE